MLAGLFWDTCNKCGTSRGIERYMCADGKVRCFCFEHAPKQEKKQETKPKNSWNTAISPTSFDDYIGQEPVKEELETMLAASKKTGIPVQHVLFSGGFGLGKTTLAKIFAQQLGKYELIVGANASPSTLPSAPILIIDEIHTVSQEEWLLHVMDSGQRIILGTTTTAGSLSGPLRSRFVSFVLQPYEVDELADMVWNASSRIGRMCNYDLAFEVAKRSKTVARTSLQLYKRIFDRIVLSTNPTIEQVQDWFIEMQIDEDGLDNADRAYLNCLDTVRPVGLQYISSVTGFDKTTIEETIEPYLLRQRYVIRTPRGRIKGNKEPMQLWD